MFWETNQGINICKYHTYPGSFWKIKPMFSNGIQKEQYGEVQASGMER